MLCWSSLSPPPPHIVDALPFVCDFRAKSTKMRMLRWNCVEDVMDSRASKTARSNKPNRIYAERKVFQFLHTGKRQIDETEYRSKSQRRKENTISRCVGLWKSGFQFTLQEKWKKKKKKKNSENLTIYDVPTYLQQIMRHNRTDSVTGSVKFKVFCYIKYKLEFFGPERSFRITFCSVWYWRAGIKTSFSRTLDTTRAITQWHNAEICCCRRRRRDVCRPYVCWMWSIEMCSNR